MLSIFEKHIVKHNVFCDDSEWLSSVFQLFRI